MNTKINKRPLFFTTAVILGFSLILTGCTYKVKKPEKKPPEVQTAATPSVPGKLTAEEIKKKYTDTKVKSIQNIGEDFALVESQQDTFANKFDIYNLVTGDVETLPTMPDFVTLEKAVNENYFIFLASGKNSESPFGNFPHLISCIRVKNDANKEGNFIRLEEDKYYNLDYSVQAGSKEGTLMSNVNVSFDGLEVLFEPVKGKELQFYADATDIPPTKTTYNMESKQIMFEIGTNQLSEKLKGMKKVKIDNNQVMSAYEITQKDNKTYLSVTVTDSVKTYNVKIKRLPNGLPYFTIVFTGE